MTDIRVDQSSLFANTSLTNSPPIASGTSETPPPPPVVQQQSEIDTTSLIETTLHQVYESDPSSVEFTKNTQTSESDSFSAKFLKELSIEDIKVSPPVEEFPRLVTDSGPVQFYSRNPVECSLIRQNNGVHDQFLIVVGQVDAEIAAGTLNADQRKEAIIDRLLPQLAGDKYEALSSEQKESLRQFLMQFDLNELIGAQVQGSGGAAAGAGVTGNGQDGQYVNSILSSVNQLIQTDRLTPEVLSALNDMASAELHEDLTGQRNDLIRSTLQEIAFPESISQHARGTCAGTTCQILYAIKEPARYVQVIQGLASPSGNVPAGVLLGNGRMTREAGTLQDDGSGRCLSSRMFQPAAMEYANDASVFRADYNNETDQHEGILGIDFGGGLFQDETTHLLEGLFGEGTYTEVSGSGDELIPQIEERLRHGEPVPVGMRWQDGAHEILLTRIDRENNTVYYMNPWGELQTMPLEDLNRRINSASLATVSDDSQDALSRLPGAAGNTENYQPIEWFRYRTLEDHMQEDETVNHYLSDTQREQLLDKFEELGMSAYSFNNAISLIESGNFSQTVIDRLMNITDTDEAVHFLQMANTLVEGVADGNITADQAREIFASYPEKHLNTQDFDALQWAVRNGNQTEIERLTQQSRQTMLQDAMGTEDVPETLSQEQIRTRFSDLEGGWTTDAEYEQLEQLASVADADTKAWMMRQLMDGPTTARAERAMTIILGNSNREQQRAILNALDLGQLGSELENGDEAAEVLNTLIKAGFDADLMESHMQSFFDGVTSQSSLFSLFNTDDDTADSFVRKLDPSTLAALPASIKMRLFQALDNGTTQTYEFQRMREIGRAASPEQKAQMIQYLMDQEPTTSEQETLIANMIRDTSPSDLVQVLEHVDGWQLADELENDREAADVGVRIAQAYQHAGKHPIAGELNDFLQRLAYDHRDEAINAFINHPDVQANGRALYKNISSFTLHNMVERLMSGDTDEAEEDTIVKILSNTSWDQYSAVMSNRDPTFLRNLVDELDQADIVKLMTWSTTNGNLDSVRTMYNQVCSEYPDSSDDYAEAFVRGLSNNQLNSIPRDILHKMYTAMDDGWTTDGEYAMMAKLERARNW